MKNRGKEMLKTEKGDNRREKGTTENRKRTRGRGLNATEMKTEEKKATARTKGREISGTFPELT